MAKRVKDKGTGAPKAKPAGTEVAVIAPAVLNAVEVRIDTAPWPEPSLGAYMGAFCHAAFVHARQYVADVDAKRIALGVSMWDKATGIMALLSKPIKAKIGKAKKGTVREPLNLDEHLTLLGLTMDDVPRIKFQNEAQETWRKSADVVYMATGARVGPMPADFPATFKARIEAEAKAVTDAAMSAAAMEEAVKAAAKPQSTALVPVTSVPVVAAIAALDAKAAASEPLPTSDTAGDTDGAGQTAEGEAFKGTVDPLPEHADNGELPPATRPIDTPDMVQQIAAAMDAGDASASASTEGETTTSDPLAGDTSETNKTASEHTTGDVASTDEPAPTGEAGNAVEPAGATSGETAPDVPASLQVASDNPSGGEGNAQTPQGAAHADNHNGGGAGVGAAGSVLAGDTAPVADSACTSCEPDPVTPLATPDGVAAIAADQGEISPLDVTPAATGEDTASDTGQEAADGHGEPQTAGTAQVADVVDPEAVKADGQGGQDGAPSEAAQEDLPATSEVVDVGNASEVEVSKTSTEDAAIHATEGAPAGDGEPAPTGVASVSETPADGASHTAVAAEGDGQPDPLEVDTASANTASADAGAAIQPENGSDGDGAGNATADPALPLAAETQGALPLVPLVEAAAPEAAAAGTQGAEALASGVEPGAPSQDAPKGEGDKPNPMANVDVVDGKLFSEKTPEQQAAARKRIEAKLGPLGTAGKADTSAAIGSGATASATASGEGTDVLSLGEQKKKVEHNLSIARAAFEADKCETTAMHFRSVARQMKRECGAVFGYPDWLAVREETRQFVQQTNQIGRKNKLGKLAAAQATRPGYAAAAVAEATETPEQARAGELLAAARTALVGVDENAAAAGVVLPDEGRPSGGVNG